MNKGLIIFAREPVPGKVKTRLARDIGDKSAADIYSAMLGDIINQTSTLKDIRVLIFWSLENEPFPAINATAHLGVFRQKGSDLGERMANAFSTAFANDINACCIIGSDSPDLPVDFITQAFTNLACDETDIVYGPTEDGGYYLLGMKQLWQRIFENIPWSSPAVLNTTRARIDELKLNGKSLPIWYDIDTLADLQQLAAGSESSAPLTRTAFQSVFPHVHSSRNTGTI